MAELCGYCRRPALGYAWLADGTRVCHHDMRSCYNACTYQGFGAGLTPSADVPACRDEDPATAAVLAAAYPDPPEYPHPEEPEDADR